MRRAVLCKPWTAVPVFLLLMAACSPRVEDKPIDPAAYDHPVRVACLGDSLTDCADCWPAPLSERLGPRWEVRNFGRGGSCVLSFGDYPYEKMKFGEIADFRPDVAVVLLGTNDSKPRHWYYRKEFERDYNHLIRALKKLDPTPRIWICLPPPTFPGQWGIDDDRLLEMQPVIRRIARRHGIPLLDLHTPFLDKGAWFPDQIHPNAEASREMAGLFAEALTGNRP